MLLGLNIGHDASAAVTDSAGRVLAAIQEERISRTKNHIGIPFESIKAIGLQHDLTSIDKIVIGWQSISKGYWQRSISDQMENEVRRAGTNQKKTPGLILPDSKNDLMKMAFDLLSDQIPLNRINIQFVNHHNSHIGCALGTARDSDSALLLSLDGEGDGESGAVAHMSGTSYRELARFKNLDSLGHLYSAVTRAYSFKPLHHEGKITGLAAFGNYSKAVDVLLKYVNVVNGYPFVDQQRNFKDVVSRLFERKFGLHKLAKKSLDEIVEAAENSTSNFYDLAFAVQHVLEYSVIEIVQYWQSKVNAKTLCLAGGVFGNVKLNQRLAELKLFDDVRIFPNMGDGGVALGGVWFDLNQRHQLARGELFSNMYLGPIARNETNDWYSSLSDSELKIVELNTSQGPQVIAEKLAQKKLVAIHSGLVEFGPRALGNRSILIDPRNREVNQDVNRRLNRSDFMPFAPVVREEDFFEFFVPPGVKSLYAFRFMTMTCDVIAQQVSKIPGVVHEDGTARPQIVNKSENTLLWKILEEFKSLTGIGVLVNTSLNMHEEPINYSIKDSLSALKRGAVDYLFYPPYLINLRNSID